MDEKTKKNLPKYLLLAQVSIYVLIVIHSIAWYVLGIHLVPKLCPFLLADQIGSLELSLAVLFWGLVFLSTLLVGRAFCAWGCMFGAYQDFVARIARALKIKPLKSRFSIWLLAFVVTVIATGMILSNKNYWPTFFWFAAATILLGLALWLFLEKGRTVKNLLSFPKYVLFAQYLAGVIALWITLDAFQKGFTFVSDKYPVFYNEQWIVQFALAAAVALSIVLVDRRAFCRYLCPIGLTLRVTSAIPFPKKYRVRATNDRCIECGKCNRECPMGVKPMEEIGQHGAVKNPDCINCMACVSACPKDVLDFRS